MSLLKPVEKYSEGLIQRMSLNQACYRPQACVKIKRYSPEMVGGNLRKKRVSVSVSVVVLVALELDTPFFI
jgi:hypothetical protein